MRIIFSRKGFDSSSGGAPSPIVDGVPVSLPIPAGAASATSYNSIGLGELVEQVTRGRITGRDPCHHDPMFDGSECLFGQCGAAQTHLVNQGVGLGDVFVFFGLFREEATGEPHHRIFGLMDIERVIDLTDCSAGDRAEMEGLGHPHALTMHARNDVIYRGQGSMAKSAAPELRLTVPGGPPSLWAIPDWLRETGLSYHDQPDRWRPGSRLQSVARGQEFVADIGALTAPRDWLDQVRDHIG